MEMRLQNVAHQWLANLTRKCRATGQIGVYLTPEGAAAAHVATTAAGKPRLTRCVYEKEGGRDVLARLAARLPNRRARAVGVLDEAAYRLLLVEAPDVPADELRAAVRWRIKDLIDFHIDDAVVDVFEMPRHARGGPQRPMYAVTAKADVVKHEIERIEAAGLGLEAVDIPELCLRNVAMLLDSGRGAALLYLGERRSTLLLVRQGVLYLARHIETGVATLAEAGELRADLVAALALEIRRSLDYLESHYEQTSMQRLCVSGLEAADREAIARDLGLPVEELDLATLFEADEAPSPELARLCMPAIGAALRKDPLAL
jgi:MSHA biogenesis protein MshI